MQASLTLVDILTGVTHLLKARAAHAAAKPVANKWSLAAIAVVPIGGVISAGSHIATQISATFRAADILLLAAFLVLNEAMRTAAFKFVVFCINANHWTFAVFVIAGAAHIVVVLAAVAPFLAAWLAEALLIVAETANCEEAARGVLDTASNAGCCLVGYVNRGRVDRNPCYAKDRTGRGNAFCLECL